MVKNKTSSKKHLYHKK